MTNNKICTEFELKEFAWNSKPTAFNFARWIESKTNNQYTIIHKEFILELLAILENNITVSITTNSKIRKKWKEDLKLLLVE